jgi:hypothetical protein
MCYRGPQVLADPYPSHNPAYNYQCSALVCMYAVVLACRFGGATFMCFKDLTLVPIQTKMINPDLITPLEEQWLDNYHKQVCSQPLSCKYWRSPACVAAVCCRFWGSRGQRFDVSLRYWSLVSACLACWLQNCTDMPCSVELCCHCCLPVLLPAHVAALCCVAPSGVGGSVPAAAGQA